MKYWDNKILLNNLIERIKMQRRNLIQLLTTLIPLSLLSKNVIANEDNEEVWEKNITDENENIIRKEFSNGHYIDFTYNKSGQQLTRKDSDGYWEEYTYNEKGQNVFYQNSNNFWHKQIYNEKGQITFYQNSDDFWQKTTWSKHNKIITCETSKGYSIEYTYDENGNELTRKDHTGYWSIHTYDKHDHRLTSIEDSIDGYQECLYNSKGQYLLIPKIKLI